MWDDDHISRQLLALHLDPESDAASRKQATIEKTVQWIESFCCGSQKTILDLGCGPGLYSRILAEHGHTVTGVDLSARSIDHAQKAAAESGLAIEYIRKNYLDLDFSDRFDIVLMIYCDFDVLVPEDRDRLLKTVWRSLRPGGLFIFDTLNEKAPGIMKVPSESREVSEGGFWRSGPYEALSETFHYPEAGVILQQHTVCPESGARSVYRFWTHYYREEDLAAILSGNGFAGTEYYREILPDDGSGTGTMVMFCVTRKVAGR
jgi:SAM-dependent methyltransferase